MLTAIPAVRARATTTAHTCLRCGIDYQAGHTVIGERARFCKDCRWEATFLGWCEPTKHSERRAQATTDTALPVAA